LNVPTEIEAALVAMKDDALLVCVLVLACIAAVQGFKFIVRGIVLGTGRD
jgi:hypothetical protein